MRFPSLVLAGAIGAALLMGDLQSLATSATPSPSKATAEPGLMGLIDKLRGKTLPDGIVQTNGRIEATEVDVSAKYGGRLSELLVKEGDDVTAGQIIARISSPETEAQLRGAQAKVLEAKQAYAEAVAVIAQRNSDLIFARADWERGQQLVKQGYLTQQTFDLRQAKYDAATASVQAANAQRDQAQFSIESSEADVQRLEATLVDLVLRAPVSGRVLYKLVQSGEVVAPGMRIVTLLDLSDVYMTIYLPAAQAGRLSIGDEARLIVDPAPEYVIPASISFVATDAQFTPKTVETDSERTKLMFRVKLQLDPKLLKQYAAEVKTGVRGIGYVRTSVKVPWPPSLATKLPATQ